MDGDHLKQMDCGLVTKTAECISVILARFVFAQEIQFVKMAHMYRKEHTKKNICGRMSPLSPSVLID